MRTPQMMQKGLRTRTQSCSSISAPLRLAICLLSAASLSMTLMSCSPKRNEYAPATRAIPTPDEVIPSPAKEPTARLNQNPKDFTLQVLQWGRGESRKLVQGKRRYTTIYRGLTATPQ